MTQRPHDDRGRYPSVGVGIVVVPERSSLARRLLADLAAQTHAPDEIVIVLQGVSSTEPSASDSLADGFPNLPITVIANTKRSVNSARNLLLDACRSDVLMFMDDDARLNLEAVARVAGAFEHRPEAAVITFKTRWTGDDPRPRRYPAREGLRRTVRSITPVAAVEMAASVPRLVALGVRFDERFGPGGRFGAGDEFLFLIDVLRAGGAVAYVPVEVAEHEAQTGGRRMTPEKIAVRGAMLRRAFGAGRGFGAGLLFVARKSLTRELECSVVTALRAVVDGWRAFGRPDDGARPGAG